MTDIHAKEWGDTGKCQPPRPLLPEIAAPNEYPVKALPPLMRDAALAIADHVMAPLALAGQSIVGAAVHLAQTRVNAPHMHSPSGMPSSVFLLTLGESGDRKSATRKLAFKEIDDKEKADRAAYQTECANIINQANQLTSKKAREQFMDSHPLPPDPSTQYTDATFERIAADFIRGKACASWDTDEGGQMLGGASLKSETRTASIGGLCKAFDDGRFERSRAASNAEVSGIAFRRRLSIHLMAQPVAVAEALADPLLRGQGFLPRFLFTSPQSLAGTRILTPERMARKSYGDPRLQRYWQRCREIMASAPHIDESGEVVAPALDMDRDAAAIWLEFYNETESEQSTLGRYAGLRPFAARAGEQARRLAAVFACFEGVEEIDGDCMRRACELVRHSLAEWLRYTDAETIHPDLRDAAAVMAWMRDPVRADSWRTFDKVKAGKSWPPAARSAKVRDRLLGVLVEYGHLLTSDGKQFRINPLAETAETAETQQARGLSLAEDLRRAAENMGITTDTHQALAETPQLSAEFPQAETQQPRGLPQNPQNPQPQPSATAGAEFEEF